MQVLLALAIYFPAFCEKFRGMALTKSMLKHSFDEACFICVGESMLSVARDEACLLRTIIRVSAD